MWGERTELDLVVRNAKPLPLPWLQIDDFVSHGADFGETGLVPSVRQGFDVLRQTWSIGWFERVTRRLQVVGSRRGTFRFVSSDLRIADVFGSGSQGEERLLVSTYRVVPRVVPVRALVSRSPMIGCDPNGTRPLRGSVPVRRRPPIPAGRPAAPDPLEGDGPRRPSGQPTVRSRTGTRDRPRDRHPDDHERVVDADMGRRRGRGPLRRRPVDGAFVHPGRDRGRPGRQCLQRSAAAHRLRPGRAPARTTS